MRLPQSFFRIALLVVLAIVAAFGGWAGQYVSDSIVRGVGGTAAGSIEALIARNLDGVLSGRDVSAADRLAIEAAFDIASETEDTRLLMLVLRQSDGRVVLQVGNDLADINRSEADQAAAMTGQVVTRFTDVVVPALGDLPALSLPVMKITTALSRSDGTSVGVAELFFGARAVRQLQARATSDSWIIAALVGFFALGTVALLIDVAGRVILEQRRRLARNLRRTRQLLRENVKLQEVSDSLRMEAILANERVLVEVGSDIHDGPLQLLTLLILQLPAGEANSAQSSQRVAQRAMSELRTISAGLVLPELANAGLREAIEVAIVRHEDLTGTDVQRSLDIAEAADAPLSARICAYRVVQEALTNAHRHGAGDAALVDARTRDGWLEIEITNPVAPDDGAHAPRDQLGLRTMRFRVESQGGRLNVSLDGAMARVRAAIPLDVLPHPLLPGPSSMP